VSCSLTELAYDPINLIRTRPTALQLVVGSGPIEWELQPHIFSYVNAGDEPGQNELCDLCGAQTLSSFTKYNADLSSCGLDRCRMDQRRNIIFSLFALDLIRACLNVGTWADCEAIHSDHYSRFWRRA
jgi:hypothetical protein